MPCSKRDVEKEQILSSFPVTESPPSHVSLGRDADKHWVVSIVHMMGTCPGHMG
jgi:hypothetical protein